MILKITSDEGKIITYIDLKKVFSIKASESNDGKPSITFYSESNKMESFSFDSIKSRDGYIKYLEENVFEDSIFDDQEMPDFEEEEQKTIEEYLDQYDPMSNLKEGEENE